MSFLIRCVKTLVSGLGLGFILASFLTCNAFAATGTNPRVTVRPKARVVDKVDGKKLTAVAHSHPQRVTAMMDMGRLPVSTPLHGMTLILKASAEQDYALVSLLDEQQKTGHANFHQWMTPESFGTAFGVHSDDIAKVSAWLQSSGFSVDKVAKGARFIQFSGAAGQVETAFHTELHTYSAKGQTRISNSTDISIPTALAPVVRGLVRLNNFGARQSSAAAAAGSTRGVREADGSMHVANAASPDLTTGGPLVGPTGTAAGAHFLTPADLAAIYDTNPLLAKGINGRGVSIGIVGESDVLPSDIATYRSAFGLPVNAPTITQVGNDPGIESIDPANPGLYNSAWNFPAEAQGLVDMEIAGAMAPMASIVYAPAGYTDFDYFAGDMSAAYLVDNNVTDIIVDSYNIDEADLSLIGDGSGVGYDDADLVFYQVLWEQAAAQGQSVFVTAGTTGPDSAAQTAATAYGAAYAVNGIASTGYNVAVGSTEFNEGAASYATLGASPFWGVASTSSPYESALSYIPENAWNQGKYGTINGAAISGATGNAAGGGGVSAYSLLPNWQVGPAINIPTSDPVPGAAYGAFAKGYYQVAGTSHRLMPDVSMPNGSHDGVIYCIEGSCTLGSTGVLQNFSVVNGAAYVSPGAASMAGIQALINQQQAALNPNSPSSTRQGNPNFYYYRIAALQNETACDSDTYVTTGTAACGFHDIQTGNTYTPASRNGTTEIGWSSGVGYDLTTGLGSPDAANLAALWSTVTFSPTTVGFNVVDLNSSSSQVSPILINHGDYIGMTVNVFPVDSTGTPNGSAGDGTSSGPTGDVAIIAQAASSQGGAGYYTVGCANNPAPPTPYPGNTLCFGIPGDGNAYDSLVGGALNMSGNFPAIPGGTYNLYAHYAGDTMYGASNSQLVQVTVAPEITTLEVDPYYLPATGNAAGVLVGPPVTSFLYGQNVYLDTSVNFGSGYGTPTGTVTYTINNGVTSSKATSKLDDSNDTYFDAGPGLYTAYNVTPTYPVLPVGTYSISATYSGDASFAPSTAPAFSITVGPASPTVRTTVVSADVKSGNPATLLVTVSNAAAAQFPGGYAGVYATGTVTFVDTTTGVTLGTTTASQMVNGAVTFTTPALTTLGANAIVATYNGDTNYSAKAATSATVTVVATTAATVTVTAPATAQVGTAVSLVATVSAATATTAVYFYANGIEIGTANIVVATHTATLTYKNFAVGTYAITASFAGTATVPAASTTVSAPLTVTQNTPTLTISAPATGDTGSGYTIAATLALFPNNGGTATLPNPLPNTTVNFYQGATLLGSATAAYLPASFQYIANFTTTAITPGASTLTATFAGDANYATASATEAVNLGATTTAFSTPATITVGTGQPTVLTAVVTPTVATTTSVGGTVSFYDGGTLLGTASPVVATVGPLTMTGVATISSVLSTTVTHSLSAVYSGDSHFTGSTGNLSAIVGTSSAGSFTIGIAPTQIQIEQGSSATVAVTATVTGNWAGTVPVTCSNLPAHATCLFTYGTAKANAFALPGTNGTFTGTLTVVTADSFDATHAGLFWIPSALLGMLLMLGRRQLSLRGRQLVMMLMLLCGALATTACGSGGPVTLGGGTPLGLVTITVTGTGTGSTAASPSLSPGVGLIVNVVQ